MRQFDRKFGERLIEESPVTPAVYLFKDGQGSVLYEGKAGNIRRRLQQYRNAYAAQGAPQDADAGPGGEHPRGHSRGIHGTRRPAARERVDSQAGGLRYNEDGTYDFLYPAIGLGGTEKQVLLCFTTHVDAWENLDLRWYGVFKSRMRALAGFDALVYLLGLIGHIEPVRHLPSSRTDSRIPPYRISPVVIRRRYFARPLPVRRGFRCARTPDAQAAGETRRTPRTLRRSSGTSGRWRNSTNGISLPCVRPCAPMAAREPTCRRMSGTRCSCPRMSDMTKVRIFNKIFTLHTK